jgi:uncharacterized protein YdaU (DUF1376 family)
VNYYERNLGDYYRDAGHLSMLQHGAYTLLLDKYYTSEKGIPDDQKYHIARAKTYAERRAVDQVLVEFFYLQETGIWVKNRCAEELSRALARIHAARENGSKGGRPKKPNANPGETQRVIEEKPKPLIPLTQSKALQSPGSNLQAPVRIKNSPSEANGEFSNLKRPPPKSPRNADWESILKRVALALRIEDDPAHPDYTTLAKVSALTEAQCREAVKQLADRGRLPRANGKAAHDA